MISRARVTATLLLAVGACVPYVPRPVEPAAHPAEYRARRLDDPKLVDWVARWAARPEPRRWTDRQLALVALGLRAELARARADWRTAAAGARSAGARPQPGIEAGVERAVSGTEGQAPWVVSLAGLFAIELGGKRGARLQQARARTAVAEGELRLTAWRIVQAARAAVAAVDLSEAELQQAHSEEEALGEVLKLERARYEEASLTLAELARTASEVQDARARAGAAEAAALEARAELAGILALPVRALDSVVVTQDGESGCGSLDDLGPDSLIALTLHRRPEVGRVLAEYAVAEADLRLAVARQYPDLNLGPGFTWDQGIHRWTLALALPNLFGFRNRAAIDEADAARTAAAARVAEIQDELLAEVELAMARCRGAMLERAAADSQMTVVRRAAELARAGYDRGETSRLDPALAGLAVVRTERARQSAERRVRTAGQALDAASAGWTGGTSERWPDPRTDDLVEGAPE